VGLYFVDRMGRRPLTIASQTATVFFLTALSTCFYFAQVSSISLNDAIYQNPTAIPDNDCSSYRYCFDCVQNEHCGYCGSTSTPTSYSDVCIRAGGDNYNKPSNTSICAMKDFSPEECPGSELMGWLIFLFLCLYLLGFSPGMGPMPWTVNSEIYPTAFRGMGGSIATTVNWTTNILMSMTFLSLVDIATNQGAFLLYAAISLVFLAIFVVYLPETKGLPLESITYLFDDNNWGKSLYQNCTGAQGEERKGGDTGGGTHVYSPLTHGEIQHMNDNEQGPRESPDIASARESLASNMSSQRGSRQSAVHLYQGHLSGLPTPMSSVLPPVEMCASNHSSDVAADAMEDFDFDSSLSPETAVNSSRTSVVML
jgi:hypothetical protein